MSKSWMKGARKGTSHHPADEYSFNEFDELVERVLSHWERTHHWRDTIKEQLFSQEGAEILRRVICRILAMRGLRGDSAAEMQQEVITLVWRRLINYGEPEKLAPNLKGFILNRIKHGVIDLQRSAGRLRTKAEKINAAVSEKMIATGKAFWTVSDPLEQAELAAFVVKVILECPKEAQRVLLRWRQGKSASEIAEETGKSLQAVQNILSRWLPRVSDIVREWWEE